MQAGSIEVDLDLRHHVDVSLARELAAAQLVDGLVLVGLRLLVVDGHRARDVAFLQEGLDQDIVAIAAVDVANDGKVEAGALDDVEGEADDGRLDLGVEVLFPGSLLRQVMHIRDAVGRDGNVVDGHGLEVGDTAAKGALHQEGVTDGLEAGREFGLAHSLELVGTQEDRCVVHGFHDGFAVLLAQGTEGRALDVAVEFEVVEEGLEHLELADYRIGGKALLGEVLGLYVFVELGVLVDVLVLVVQEVSELEQHVVVEFGRGEMREALDGKEALQLVADHGDMGSASRADNSDFLCVVDVFVELGDEGLGVAAARGRGVAQFLNGGVHHVGEHIHAFLLHLFVGLAHQVDLLVDGVVEVAVVDGDAGLEFAVWRELVQVLFGGLDVGFVGDVGFSSVAQTETNGILFGIFLS